MRNERLVDLRQLQQAGAWPTYYVVTDGGCYEYKGQSFVKTALPASSIAVAIPPEHAGAIIRDIRGDGESAVIRLDSEDMIVLDLRHDPFGSTIESHPEVRFVAKDKAQEWRDEYDAMDPM